MASRNEQTAYRPNGTTHVIAGGTAAVAQTNPITDGVNRVSIASDAAVFIRLNPTGVTTAATVNDFRLPANWVIDYAVAKGDKFNVITATGSANVYIQEVTAG